MRATKDVIVAIDPGYDRLGIAVFEGKDLIHSECYTPPKNSFENRLQDIHECSTKVIQKYKPSSIALETLFFSTNVKTAIKVSEARGVILLAAAESQLKVYEYSPQAVKIAVTGSGNASKDAVIRMVQRLVKLDPKKRLDDEYDAIALGIAHTVSHALSTQRGI
jgi:crossover junction endodeoxyribonuclease RuvC